MKPSYPRLRSVVLFLAAIALAGTALADKPPAPAHPYPFVFRDVGEQTGFLPLAAGIRGHGAAWGDADGDGYPDLFIGTFHDVGSKPSMLLYNRGGKFHSGDQSGVRVSSAASGAVFVDLANRGRLDLYVSNNANRSTGPRSSPSALFRNEGGGRFTDVSAQSGACPAGFLGRSAAALDFDGDGLLDLVVCEFYYGTDADKGIALYRNLGNYRFRDVAEEAGLPRGSAISGVAVADVNRDGWPDLFLVDADGNNRLYLNDGHGRFREAPGTRQIFAWKTARRDSSPTGVSIVDVNRDGLPDIVVGQHFKMPWRDPVSERLYLHRGIRNGNPVYEEVTQKAGLTPLAMKAPHVEIQDFDNDGWPDIFVSIVKYKDGKPYPVIFRNQGVRGGMPRFRDDAWAVNDFPADVAQGRGSPSKAVMGAFEDKEILYSAAAPTADFDRDGRLDLVMLSWWIDLPPLLLRNETPGGNWLDVAVEGPRGVNRQGVGSRIQLYPAGKLGEQSALLGCREIQVGFGWCSGQEAVAHFGLGREKNVDIEVVLPHGKGRIVKKNVTANQRIIVRQ